MHRRRSRRLARLLASVLLCLPLTGCGIVLLTIEIPDFDNVEGLWLWRLSATGEYQRSGLIRFSSLAAAAQGEVDYRETCANGTSGIANQAAILQRAPDDPSTATLSLHYLSCEQPGGIYRATAFNTAGESGLSATTISF